MSQLFALDAQKAGFGCSARAQADGFGVTLYLDGEPRRAGSFSGAIRIVRDYVGGFLLPVQRGGTPWGLRVTVSGGMASYGEWPLAGGGRSPDFEHSPLVRIRNRWHDSGPLSALENAVQIIRAYGPEGRAAA